MTSHHIRELEDGTRVYYNGTKYKPKSDEDRKYKVRKPADPRAFRWGEKWFIFPELLNLDDRVMPLTQPDRTAYEHCLVNKECECEVCARPEARRWRSRAYAELRRRRESDGHAR